ncbi:hypothetical protein ACN23B_10150 [Anabaena sp. FACHB-709]|uniref:Uncharacterized protein n=2 Tax=Nostocaceae TaxID=1162 RepID=A0A1Z4KF67_ANAVA|nr:MULTISPECIES: hypothetical protein [Nostocaceae]BAY67648.1 hypothetical protein NIES23_04260 [Trichormus variabilis NIES-23]HBW33034.1 hypothetical protein [Nostoc sp. UBA8866]MBD2173923.1 hypothetical protein [Anabaena cylindrica FACHB-318]MBD2265672.1 hypothetical protein [Anabaena sp. FACHB-709]MBD2275029.1 hypothetical protein [Nostoc sp. PCC 7120 = FACHB-418]
MNHLNEENQDANISSEELLVSQPLLPRFAWEDERAFLREVIKAKQALDIAELTAIIWQKTNH